MNRFHATLEGSDPSWARRLAGVSMMALAAVAGIASREAPLSAWPIVGPWGGDAAWTMAACGGVRAACPRWSARQVAFTGYLLSVLVEVSQLVHVGWLDEIRGHPLGALLIGRGFLWSDLVAYGGGALLAGAIDRAVLGPGPRPASAENQSDRTGREAPPSG